MKRKQKIKEKIKVVFIKTEHGFESYTKAFPEFKSSGSSWRGAKRLFLKEFKPFIKKKKDKEGQQVPNYSFTFHLDVQQLLKLFSIFNVSAFAAYIGINKQLIHHYKGYHKFPSESTSLKILNGLKKIGQKLTAIKV